VEFNKVVEAIKIGLNLDYVQVAYAGSKIEIENIVNMNFSRIKSKIFHQFQNLKSKVLQFALVLGDHY
jgi:hypothetical protein